MKIKKGKTYRVGTQGITGRALAHLSANNLLKQIAGNPSMYYLIPSFVTALCAGIEGCINDAYIAFLYRKIGVGYKDFARPFLMMNLKDRIRLLIPLISEYRYQLNERSPNIKAMFNLFENRNRLVHIKHHIKPQRLTVIDEGHYFAEFESPDATDFYESKDAISVKDLRSYMRLFKYLISYFGEITSRINGKRFNPKGELTEIALKTYSEELGSTP